MEKNQINTELFVNRLVDSELTAQAEHELNLALIREPEMMRLRDEYQKIDALAASAMEPLRSGADIDLKAVFEAPAPARILRMRAHHGWLMIPGAIAAALLAMVIPDPNRLGDGADSIMTGGRELYSATPGMMWNGSDLARPVSTAPKVRSQTGREVIGVVGDDGNLYWIEVERKRTVRWPAGSSPTPNLNESM